MARVTTIEGKHTVITDTDALGKVTRWTLAPGQIEKHKLDAAQKASIDAAPKATRDAIAAAELEAAVLANEATAAALNGAK